MAAAALNPEEAIFEYHLYTDELLRRVGLRQRVEEPLAFFQDLMNFMGWLDAPARRPAEA